MCIDYHWLVIPCIFMVVDVLSGFGQAAFNGTIDSTKMREGLKHKVGFLAYMSLGVLCDYTQATLLMETIPGVDFIIPTTIGIATYIIGMEIVSIRENCALMNPLIKKFDKKE